MITRVYRGISNPYKTANTGSSDGKGAAGRGDGKSESSNAVVGSAASAASSPSSQRPGSMKSANGKAKEEFCNEYDCIIYAACWFYPEWC